MSASAWLGGDQTLTSSGLHEMALGPLLVLIVTLVLTTTAEHLLPIAFERGAALLRPWLLGSGVLAILVGGLMLGYSIFPGDMTMTHFWCAAAFIVLAARSNGWSLPALLPLTAGAALLALLGVPRDSLPDVIEAIQEPWKLSLFACALLACTHGGRWIHRRWPTLFVSEHAPKPIPSTIPFTAFGVALALTGLVEHVAAPVYRDAVAQVGTPFLSACTLAAAGLALGATFVVPFLAAAGLSVGIGTVLAVRVFAGPWLQPLGANEVHLVVIGLAFDVILAEAVAAACRRRWGSQTFRWVCAMPAALIPTLLAIGYAYRPGLGHTNSVRCLVSGLCALVAAAPFRRFRDQEGEAPLAIGLPISLALGIAALSMAIPWLRQPDWALTALLLPPAVLLLLNQVDKGAPESCRRATGDVVLWLVAALLALQLVPAFYQLLCFAGPRSWLGHFHAHALVPLGGGMILALLGKWQKHQPAAYLSGILLAMGGYAVVAQWPLIWAFPGSFPMAATVWLLIWAHVCLALAGAKGFHRWLIGPEAADGVGLLWRTFVCCAAQAVVLAVIGTGTLSTYASAPLLAGAASLLVHTVAYGAPRWVGAVALLELLASIHLDFVTPSYLPKDMVIWVLLGTWAALLLADRLLRNRIRQATAAASQALVVFALAHVWYCDPGTPTGLVGMGLAALLYALSPLREPTETAPEGAPEPLLFLVPAWLLFWGVRGAASLAVEPPTLIRASLAAAGGLLLTTPLTVWQNPDRLLALWHQRRPIATRRVDAALLWVQTHAQRADMGALIFASLACLAACMYPNLGLANTALAVALLTLLAWGWWRTARRQQDASCVVVALAALLLIPYAIRSHLLATEHWQPEWDIWAVLALSSILCLFAQWFSRQEPYARIPLLALFWGLPILNIVTCPCSSPPSTPSSLATWGATTAPRPSEPVP
jgi:hypothetical protein